jgi:hypothetical protein
MKPLDSISEILLSVKTEDEIYGSYFKKELWTIKEFTALIAGITPRKFDQLNDPKNENVTEADFELYKYANKIFSQLINDLKKKGFSNDFYRKDSEFFLTPWKYIKWATMNEISFKNRFLSALPLYLLEIISEFQPLEAALKTAPQYTIKYHRALYLKTAESVMANSAKQMTREEIYNHPTMEYMLRTFKDKNGKQVRYKKRTIIDSWLPKIDPKKRGRPKNKNKKNNEKKVS